MKRQLLLLVFLPLLALCEGQGHGTADFRSMEQKIAYLKANAAKAHPDPKPVEITESEANAFLNEGGVRLPAGVSNVRLVAHPGQIDAHALVDFDVVMQHRGANNPLAGMFTGRHDVHAVSDARGDYGDGVIHIQSVDLDGVEIPQWALEWFVGRYVTPRYPNLGITSTFKLPLRIDSAEIETGKVRLEQR